MATVGPALHQRDLTRYKPIQRVEVHYDDMACVDSVAPLWCPIFTTASSEERDHAPRQPYACREGGPVWQDNGGHSVASDKCLQASCLVAIFLDALLSCIGGRTILDTRVDIWFGQCYRVVRGGACFVPVPMVDKFGGHLT